MADSAEPDFALLHSQLAALTAGETDPLANAANFVALIHGAMIDINWAGIYVLRDTDLVLGPFQGKPACIRIPLGRGVCGVAAAQRKTLRVANVHEFAGHISCDPVSVAEIVVPLISGQELLGVLDIDSPQADRFSARDQSGLEELCAAFMRLIEANEAGFI